MMSSVLLALVLSQTAVSASRLGVYVGTDIGSANSPNEIIAACPAMAVFPFDINNVDSSVATVSPRVRTYTATCPRGTAVLQLTGNLQSALLQTPQLATTIQGIGLRSRLDLVEIPLFGDPNQVAGYWSQFAQLLAPFYLPLIGAGTISTPSAFCATLTAVRNTGFTGFGVGFQALTPMTFAANDAAFIFNQVKVACGVNNPMFVTQLSPTSGVWDQTAMNWLAWFDQQAGLAGLNGAALYQLGAAPDISNISPLLINYFPNPILPDGGSPDGGTDAGSSSGIVGPSHGSAGGTLSPPGGCSTAGPGLLLALLATPALLVLRRATRRRHQRGSPPRAP